jgi:hypothetical protein
VLAAPQDTAGLEVRVETGQADRLAPVSKESPSGVYPIKAGSDIDLAVKNTSKVAVTIGVIWYSSTGEVSAVNCWDDRDDPQIQPGTEAYCRVRQDGALEGVELHFITTPAVMPKLVHPPSGGTRGFTSGKPIVVADARQMILRLRFE